MLGNIQKGILSGGFKYILNVYPKDWGRLPSWWAYLSDWVSTTSYVYVYFRIEFLISTVFNFMAFMSGIRSRFLHVLKSYSCKLDYCNILGFRFETINWCITCTKKPNPYPYIFGISWLVFMLEKNRGIPTRAWKPSARNGHLNLDLLVMIPPSRETTKKMTCASVCLLLGTSLATNNKDKKWVSCVLWKAQLTDKWVNLKKFNSNTNE